MKQVKPSFPLGGRAPKFPYFRRGRVLFIPLLVFLAAAVFFWRSEAATRPGDSPVVEIKPNEEEPFVMRGYVKVSALTGAPLVLPQVNDSVDPGTPEEMARQYLRENAAFLHLRQADLSDLVHRLTRTSLAGPTVRFSQTVAGLPVYKGEIVVHLNHNYTVTYVANDYKPAATLASVTPGLAAGEARQLAHDYLNVQGPLDYDATTLVVYHNQGLTRLAYQVRVAPAAPLGDWEVLVDAHSGELFKVANVAYHSDDDQERNPEVLLVDGDGNVFDPDPLSSAGATYGDPGFVDGNDADTAQLNGELVNVTLQDIQFSGGMYTLIGPYAEIIDFEGPFYGLFSQASSSFLFNRFDNAFEAANTYYSIDFSMRYINETLGIALMPYQYATGVRFDPHGLNGADNSHYIVSSGRLAFGEGGVDDAEDADVILHELGHGLHDWVTGGSLSQVNGLSEGTGDYWAQSYSRSLGQWTTGDPPYHWVFNWDGHNPFWPGRVTNYFGHWPEDLTGQIHTDGQIWSTSMMKVWDAIGQQQADAALLEGFAMTNSSTNQSDAANAVFQAAVDMGYSQADLISMHTIFSDTGYIMPPLPIPDFALVVTPDTQEICAGDDTVYQVVVQSVLGYNDNVTLNLAGEPAGTTVNFSPNGNAAPYTSTLTIGNTGAAATGSYALDITGVATTATHTTTVQLDVADVPGAITLISPPDGSTQPTTPTFTWQADPQADSYTLQVATDAGFSNLVIDESGINATNYMPATPLDANTTYYWRVRGDSGLCGSGSYSAAFSFTTNLPLYLPIIKRP
ncbi:MAG: hypothetical protein L0332_00410 [Chloroflexi bacterium]|nr:hypothetical protein [Chloroflexota bacterium]MCI0575691.1 hypothetical protein [Chloroflexota bacterium]MCI0647822.1 hypothetical protein [Chloroflexota bacterium]MCI0725186.1 hypothetical protein [Chloroflexota bacterium]